MNASSGGVFPLLAQHMLDRGGYVAGAVFDKNFKVRHIVSNQKKDIRALQTSKYVQSDTSKVYFRIRELLEEGKEVLFTGCACQVAGLKAFLMKPYENLCTMDVVCHGVPSVKVYEGYLREFVRREGKIDELNFRKKSVFGWSTNLYVRFASGREYRPKGRGLYLSCFLSDWILRESCYHCEFKKMKYSDLTAADFWGIQNLEKGFEDGKGSPYWQRKDKAEPPVQSQCSIQRGTALFQRCIFRPVEAGSGQPEGCSGTFNSVVEVASL